MSIPPIMKGFAAGSMVALAILPAIHRAPPARSSRAHFTAVARSTYEYDAELGYRYVPGSTRGVEVRDGRVVRIAETGVDARGNVAHRSCDSGVIAVGDSYTAYPDRGGLTWTDDVKPCASNYARDGYGVLQMVHMAAVQVRARPVRRVLLAWITDDLTRARFWRGQVGERVVVSASRDLSHGADLLIVSPLAGVLHVGDDASSLVDVYDRLRATAQNVGLNPRHALRDFREDAGFRADVEALRGVEVVLIRLPQSGETAYADHPLAASLRAALPAARSISVPLGGEYYDDWHPTDENQRRFAAAIAEAL